MGFLATFTNNRVFLQMVRKYNRKTERATPKVEDMMLAAQSLRRQENRLSLREAAAEFGVNYKALERFSKKLTPEQLDTGLCNITFGHSLCNRVFSDDEEIMLEDYLKQASDIYYGLSPKEVRQLAYSYGTALKKSYH